MQYKWAQLDLARQMESLDFIREFIALCAKCGYNGVLLYLEDRIRTASYPYPADSQCYTPDEMRDLVHYAASLNMEVIPCVATLGHAERFLAHPELEHLSELQGDMKGRFGWTKKQTFCPTHPDFYPFLTKYLQEVAEIFPTKFFHAGLDEFWDYCLCPRCQAVAPDFAAQQALFVEHVRKVNQCLKECGKRMMMWSDMFEYYPQALPQIPHDIVMCDWQYQGDVRGYVQHLFDATVEDRLSVNASLGLECFLAPVDMLYHNAGSYLEYAEGKPFLGAILTCWEKTDAFLYRTIPTFVHAGFLMDGFPEEEATRKMMELVFGTTDAVLASALVLALSQGPWRHFSSISQSMLFSRNFTGLPYQDFQADESARRILRERAGVITTELGRRVLADLLNALEEKCISHELKRYFQHTLDGHPADVHRFQTLRGRFAALLDAMDQNWDLWRTGIAGNLYATRKAELLAQLDASHKTLLSSKFVKVRICVPDGYVVEHLRVSLQFQADGPWEQIYDGITKPQELNTALSEHFLPYQSDLAPVAMRLEAYGMGGIGLCYAIADGRKPKAITQVSGAVITPEHLLQNNINFAWLGSQSTQDAYFDKPTADTRHGVTLLLAD